MEAFIEKHVADSRDPELSAGYSNLDPIKDGNGIVYSYCAKLSRSCSR